MKRVLVVDDVDNVDKVQLPGVLHRGVAPAGASGRRQAWVGGPDVAAAARRLESAWEGLTPPPPAPVPLGFAGRVMARVREQAAGAPPPLDTNAISWAAAPTWVRATCAAALVAGVVLGAGLGSRGWLDERQRTAESVPALTESYWALVDRPSET